MLVAATMWSCSSDESLETPEAGSASIMFRVVTPKTAGGDYQSRATWSNPYEALEGTYFETHLLEDQIQVVVTDGTCRQQFAVTELFCTKTEDNLLYVSYEYTGRISQEAFESLHNVTYGKLHIIANAGVGARLDGETFFTRSGLKDDFEAIPMWGVKSCDFSKLAPDGILNVGNVALLRSMAKVVIDRDDDNDNYIKNITDVTVSLANRTGYLLPDGWTTIDNTGSLDRHAPRVPVYTSHGPVTYKVTDNHVEFYLPEIINDPDDELTITITYDTDLRPMTGKLYFRNYTVDGEPGDTRMDVLRNYIYHFVVNKPVNRDIAVMVDVLPYSAVGLDYDLGLPMSGLSLNKSLVKLYTDPDYVTASRDVLIAYAENGDQLSAANITWKIGESVSNHVCSIETDADGKCIVTPLPHASGRDLVVATIHDNNGAEVTAECVIEVGERRLSLDKAYLGLTPVQYGETTSSSFFHINVVTDYDQNATLTWELLDADNNNPSGLDLAISVQSDGQPMTNGGTIDPQKSCRVTVNSGQKEGTAYLWLHYDGPDPSDPAQRKRYSTFCEIQVMPITILSYPKRVNVVVGQSTSFTSTVFPKFSDFIPTLKYRSLDITKAIVDDDGLITGVGVGDTRIEVYNNTDFPYRISDYIDVHVTPDYLVLMRDDLQTPVDQVELLDGETFSLHALSGGVDISDRVTWEYVGDQFITCDKGLITAGGPKGNSGTTTLRATYISDDNARYSANCIFIVAPERKLLITNNPQSVSQEAEISMQAYFFPDSRPSDQRNDEITWTSADSEVITFPYDDAPSHAVATGPGRTSLTASARYPGDEQILSASTEITVRFDITMKIYDANGNFVRVIESEYKHYAGDESDNGGSWETAVDVGGLGYFDKITIPEGETWTAVVEMVPTQAPASAWKKSKRYSGYDNRIAIIPSSDGKSCQIEALSSALKVPTRYNEVTFSFEYKGVTRTRRFCVYTGYDQ